MFHHVSIWSGSTHLLIFSYNLAFGSPNFFLKIGIIGVGSYSGFELADEFVPIHYVAL